MGAAPFRIIISDDAWGDLSEIAEYWSGRGEAWRGEKYFRDLVRAARTELADPAKARRGHPARCVTDSGAKEILVFGVYRLIYDLDEASASVSLLHFRHAHRTPPRFD